MLGQWTDWLEAHLLTYYCHMIHIVVLSKNFDDLPFESFWYFSLTPCTFTLLPNGKLRDISCRRRHWKSCATSRLLPMSTMETCWDAVWGHIEILFLTDSNNRATCVDSSNRWKSGKFFLCFSSLKHLRVQNFLLWFPPLSNGPEVWETQYHESIRKLYSLC